MTNITDLKAFPDQGAFLALNNAFAEETSFLTAGEWRDLVARASHALAIGDEAFLLAYAIRPREVSANYDWFAARFERFLYIDRVVIAASTQGRGYGRALYERLFDIGRAEGFARITAEVNSDPPNPVSLTFHKRMGFVALGEQALANGKTVRYFERVL